MKPNYEITITVKAWAANQLRADALAEEMATSLENTFNLDEEPDTYEANEI